MNIASEIALRFKGLDRAYGMYDLKRSRTVTNKEKITGTAKTIQENVTEELWADHLNGINGLGIVPIMDNSMCHFGAIDIDLYKDFNFQEVLDDVKKNMLPLVPCRSKSGGLHLFLFVKEAVPAKAMKEKLGSFASLLGHGKSEIFPKQTEILAEKGDIGQWINMPYFDHERTDRYAYTLEGKKLDVKEFFKAVNEVWLSAADFNAYTIQLISDISDGPPCLQTLLSKGFSTGSRNDSMFNIAVYLKKVDSDNWEGAVDEYNVQYFTPPLSSSEIQMITKSVRRKDYNFTCDKSPLKDFCNMGLCRTRQFGIGDMVDMPQLNNLTKFDSDPPVWFVDVEGGGRLELSTEDLQSQVRFQRKCMEAINVMPPPIKGAVWQQIVQKLLETITIIEAPSDASPKGLLFEYLERFCTSRAQAKNKDELLLGKPWSDNKLHYFRSIDFMTYLERNRFKEFKVHKISSMIKEIGGTHHFFKLKGKGINVWSIPEFARQTEKFDTVEMDDGEVF